MNTIRLVTFDMLMIFVFRNCNGNPRCLKGLGQESWLMKDDNDEDTFNEEVNRNYDKRVIKFCGLRNLGATCYLNTFLQVMTTCDDIL